MNLLQETIDDIKHSGHKPEDIAFIGSEDSWHSCTWDEFTKLADRDYDNGYGAQKVASDLIIVFSDGTKMWRYEYDGSENWDYSSPFKMPEVPEGTKPVTSLFVSPEYMGWMDLADINAE